MEISAEWKSFKRYDGCEMCGILNWVLTWGRRDAGNCWRKRRGRYYTSSLGHIQLYPENVFLSLPFSLNFFCFPFTLSFPLFFSLFYLNLPLPLLLFTVILSIFFSLFFFASCFSSFVYFSFVPHSFIFHNVCFSSSHSVACRLVVFRRFVGSDSETLVEPLILWTADVIILNSV